MVMFQGYIAAFLSFARNFKTLKTLWRLQFRSMEEGSEIHDWEMVLGSNRFESLKSVDVLDENSEDGAIKADYFALQSGCRGEIPSDEESVEIGNDSDNPSWVDPDSDSRFLEMKLPMRNSEGFWSDESSNGQSSVPDGEKMENLEGESMEDENSGAQEMIAVGDGFDTSGGVKRENCWWKMPLDLLKFCIFRVRPVWSISIAAAMLGIVILGRKLYRMKQKSRIIPLRIAIDDKKVSQFVAHSARLKAISLVRYMPLIRPSLPASGATQWAALPLR